MVKIIAVTGLRRFLIDLDFRYHHRFPDADQSDRSFPGLQIKMIRSAVIITVGVADGLVVPSIIFDLRWFDIMLAGIAPAGDGKLVDPNPGQGKVRGLLKGVFAVDLQPASNRRAPAGHRVILNLDIV